MIRKLFAVAVLLLMFGNAATPAGAVRPLGTAPVWYYSPTYGVTWTSGFKYFNYDTDISENQLNVHVIPFTYFRDIDKLGNPVRRKCVVLKTVFANKPSLYYTVFHIGIPANCEPGSVRAGSFWLEWITQINGAYPQDQMHFTGEYGTDTQSRGNTIPNGTAVYSLLQLWHNPTVTYDTYLGYPFNISVKLNNNMYPSQSENHMHSGSSSWTYYPQNGTPFTYTGDFVFHQTHEVLRKTPPRILELLYPDPKHGLAEHAAPATRGDKISSFGWAKCPDGSVFVAFPGTNLKYLMTYPSTVGTDTSEGAKLCGELLVDGGTLLLPAITKNIPTGLLAVGMLVGGHILSKPMVIKKDTSVQLTASMGLDQYTWDLAVDLYLHWKGQPDPGQVVPKSLATWPDSAHPWAHCKMKIRQAAYFIKTTKDVAIYDYNGYVKDDKVTLFTKERISPQPVFFITDSTVNGLN